MQNLPWPLNSRKARAAIVGIVVLLVLLATQQVDPETATNGIIALFGILVASIAYEDAAAKKPPPGPVVRINEAAVAKVETGEGGGPTTS